MGLSALLGLELSGLPLATFARYLTQDVRSVPLLAIPFFILTGNLMNRLEMTRRIFDFIDAALGFLRGGLAHASIVASMVFGGISGSALADLAGLGNMVIHAMRRAGYRAEFSAALMVSSSLLAPILPPSIMFIIYAVLMNVSVAHMFAAGIIPGIVLAVILIANNVLLHRLKFEVYPPRERSPPRRDAASRFGRIAGAADAGGDPAKHDLRPDDADRGEHRCGLLHDHARVAVPRGVAGSGCALRSGDGADDRAGDVPDRHRHRHGVRADLRPGGHAPRARITALTHDKWVVLALVTLALLVLGCFLETVPAMLIGVPLFGPLVASFGIDPLHFGVVLTFALLLGIIHPPVGLGLFTVCAITDLAA